MFGNINNNITKIVEISDIYSDEENQLIINQLKSSHGIHTEKEHPDILIISPKDKNSIGIEDISVSTGWINTRPYNNKTKLFIITHGDLLTNQAQNALLKATEEAPNFSHIHIIVSSHKSLLETIVSRSEVIRTVTKKNSESFNINEFMGMNLVEKTKYLDKLSSENLKVNLNFLNELSTYLRNINQIKQASKVLEAKKDISQNVNRKLVYYNLLISLE